METCLSSSSDANTGFVSMGEQFTQIRRTGAIAIYRRQKPGRLLDKFEVVVLRDTPEYALGGVKIPAKKDAYPGTSAWGKMGFSPCDEDAADVMFDTLVKTRLNSDGTLKVGKRGRPSKNGNGVSVPVIEINSANPTQSTTLRKPIVLPKENFTIIDATVCNSGWTRPQIYNYVRAQIEFGKVKVSGKVPQTGRGKPTLVYSTT